MNQETVKTVKPARTYSLAYAFIIAMAVTNLSNIIALIGCAAAAVGLFLTESGVKPGKLLLTLGAAVICYTSFNYRTMLWYSQTMINDGVAFGVIFIAAALLSLVILFIVLLVSALQKEPTKKNRTFVFLSILFFVALVMEIVCVVASKGYFLSAKVVIDQWLLYGILSQSGRFLAGNRGHRAMSLAGAIVTAVILAVVAFLLPSIFGGGMNFGGSSGDTSKCTICKKSATNTFQGSGYCSEHYTDAILWAFENVAGKD